MHRFAKLPRHCGRTSVAIIWAEPCGPHICMHFNWNSQTLVMILLFTYRNQQTLRLTTDSATAKECAQCDQYADGEENIQGYVIMIVVLCHRQHKCGIRQHPNGGHHDGQSDELQAKRIQNIVEHYLFLHIFAVILKLLHPSHAGHTRQWRHLAARRQLKWETAPPSFALL